jgi:hypothetical protein
MLFALAAIAWQLPLPLYLRPVAVLAATVIALLAVMTLAAPLVRAVQWLEHFVLRQPTAPPSIRLSRSLLRRSWRRAIPPLAVAAVAGALTGAAVSAAWPTGDPHPASGVTLDASKGAPLPPQPKTRPTSPIGSIEGGDIFRVCDLDRTPVCHWALGNSVVIAGAGDHLRFRLRLHDPNAQGVPFVKVQVVAGTPVDGLTEVQALVEWPTPRGATNPIESVSDIAAVRLPENTLLVYRRSSTVLLGLPPPSGGSGRVLGRFADTILTDGVGLRNVGSPPGCWDCDLAFVREIQFDATVDK